MKANLVRGGLTGNPEKPLWTNIEIVRSTVAVLAAAACGVRRPSARFTVAEHRAGRSSQRVAGFGYSRMKWTQCVLVSRLFQSRPQFR
jgi:hypothetical protein